MALVCASNEWDHSPYYLRNLVPWKLDEGRLGDSGRRDLCGRVPVFLFLEVGQHHTVLTLQHTTAKENRYCGGRGMEEENGSEFRDFWRLVKYFHKLEKWFYRNYQWISIFPCQHNLGIWFGPFFSEDLWYLIFIRSEDPVGSDSPLFKHTYNQ